ncbi:MAG TPA: nuclear transport factor 2 family protein [Acidobacteriaceae bacterium]|jgi:ketosteroid isomerase-like protein|nr:nuclear transport factor 2 family protein [Acidobacteriaceae bacterium]
MAVCVCAMSAAPGVVRAQQADSVAPGQTQEPPAVKEFQALEDQWSNAVVKNDQYTMEFLLSPAYVDIASNGDVMTRNQLIAGLFDKGGPEPVSMEQRVVSVREFGDTAIVSGTYIVKNRANGSTKEERGIFTHIYNRTQRHWACVNAQRTAVMELAANKQKATQKKSQADEPFHIPFFHKGEQPSQTATGPTGIPPN